MATQPYLRLICSTAAALALGGCMVHPVALTEDEIGARARVNLATLQTGDAPVSGAIDLYEAMARALKFNLDARVEAAQTALRLAELDLSHWSLLPNAVANSGYAGRNNYNASSSFNVITNTPNAFVSTSTSQEKRILSGDIGFSWNVLDFGLSYIRARQSADKVLIAGELRRKIILRLMEDVRTAYFRAVSAERMMRKLMVLDARARVALAGSRTVYKDRQTSPITALTYERELVEIRRTIQELARDLSVAKAQLAALMNLKPGTQFALVV
ncbi:MAG TPA: TolC family protein, partial [Hyphomicrobiaceae bacterium]|nr:TolC family protein [Hyphomicrobiaceae bacterium]